MKKPLFSLSGYNSKSDYQKGMVAFTDTATTKRIAVNVAKVLLEETPVLVIKSSDKKYSKVFGI